MADAPVRGQTVLSQRVLTHFRNMHRALELSLHMMTRDGNPDDEPLRSRYGVMRNLINFILVFGEHPMREDYAIIVAVLIRYVEQYRRGERVNG